MTGRIATLLLGFVVAAGCRARLAEPGEDRSDAPASEVMNEFDPSVWKGRCVLAQGYALGQKIGPVLDLGGPTLGVVFDGDGDWPVALGSRVRVRGRVAERADLPVFIPDPDEPIVQGIPVAPGTDLEQARRRFVIEHPQVTLLRTAAEVEAELAAEVGETVALSGVLWSRNGVWWFSHDGVDLHLEREGSVELEDHGKALVAHGELSRKPMPRIDQIGLRQHPELAEAFVLRIRSFSPHPTWPLEACPDEP